MLKKKNILLISPERWDDHHVSKHHYATKLSKRGNNVFFLNPYKGMKNVDNVDQNLKVVDFENHIKGLRWLPGFIQSRVIANDLRRLESYLKTPFDIIWNFDTSRYYNLTGVSRDKLTICHIVDLNQDFERNRLAATSEFCFCNSEPILNELKKHNKNVLKVNHGLNIPSTDSDVDDIKLPGHNRVKVIYSGNLDIPYLNLELISILISKFIKVDFIFIGGFSDSNVLTTLKNSNFHLVGKVEAGMLQRYYSKADILIVVYDVDRFEKQLANPHKLLEYLYSGKAIVSTKTLEYEHNPLILMAQSNDGFIDKFNDVINNLEDYNSGKLSKERKMFALENSYEKQIERIEKYIWK